MHLLYQAIAWKQLSMLVYLVFSLLFCHSLNAQDVAKNSRPTLDAIPNYSTRFSTDLHFIELTGITAGDETGQEITISVTTADDDVIESIAADLVGNEKAFVSYRLREGAAGTATVKVVVADNGATPASITRTFRITCESLNHDHPSKNTINSATNHELKAYPNPAKISSRIYFSTPSDESLVAIDMYTLSGVKISKLFSGSTIARQAYSVDVDSRNLPAGVYLVKMTGQSHKQNLKFVVAK